MNFYECISRINSINSQYQIALSSFDLYQKKEEKSLYDMAEKRDIDFSEYIKQLKKEKAENNEKFDEEAFKKKHKELFGFHKRFLSYPRQQADKLKNSMRQNSLIFILSTFEIFLNDFLRYILRHRPQLIKSDRKIEIGRLIASGFDTLIAEEVERQIYTLDRKSIKDRANYFQEHLKLPWGKDFSYTEVIIKSNDIRNDIIHMDTDLKVSETELLDALSSCKSVVLFLMIGFIDNYRDISESLVKKKKHNK